MGPRGSRARTTARLSNSSPRPAATYIASASREAAASDIEGRWVAVNASSDTASMTPPDPATFTEVLTMANGSERFRGRQGQLHAAGPSVPAAGDLGPDVVVERYGAPMGRWQFRKSKSLLGGLLKLSPSRRGLGGSVGFPGFRVSRGADGKLRRTVSIPRTGLRKTDVLRRRRRR